MCAVKFISIWNMLKGAFSLFTKKVLILIIERTVFIVSFKKERKKSAFFIKISISHISIRVHWKMTHKTNNFMHQVTGFDRNSAAVFVICHILNAYTVWLGVLSMTSTCLASKIWVYLYKIIQVKRMVFSCKESQTSKSPEGIAGLLLAREQF